ncbi:MAG: ABC transporter substrate-binding protein [Limnochordaceae bacterium]|nr:ABC transporter substrate-binding protein [Limnochordaceae bacterium]
MNAEGSGKRKWQDRLRAAFLSLSVLAAGAGTVRAGGVAWAAEPIKLGLVGPLSGDAATFGNSVVNAVKLYFDEVNAKGGIHGQKVEIIALDDRGDPAEAANAVQRLITRDKVTAIIGAVTSGPMKAAAPIANRAGVPILSPTATAAGITDIGPYVFRACFVDDFQGEVMASFARHNLKFSRVAVLYKVTDAYSAGLAASFQNAFKQAGGTVVLVQTFGQNDQDFTAQLTRIKQANPEAIYTPVYYTDAGLIAKQARQLGINVPLLGPDGFDSPKLIEIGGQAVVGSYFTNHYSSKDNDPVAVDFDKKYTARYGAHPDALAALAWDGAAMMAYGLEKAGTDRKALRDALASIKSFHGVTGTITMDAHRNPIKNALILQVTADGGHRIVTRVQP